MISSIASASLCSRAAGWGGVAATGLGCAVALGVVGGVGGGCQLAIDGQLGTVRCDLEGAHGPPTCPVGQTCDDGVCVAKGATLGSRCAFDIDCASPLFCLNSASLDGAAGSFCSRPCCSSAECGPPALGQVCRSLAGGSLRVCWPSTHLSTANLGELLVGQPCQADGACRSGQCGAGTCQDVCCDHRFCSESELRCTVGKAVGEDEPAWMCGESAVAASGPEVCVADEQCPSGRCIALDETVSVCAVPCCTSTSCGSVEMGGRRVTLGCAVSQDGSLRACARPVADGATGAVGTPCASDGDCRSGRCADSDRSGYCSDACCRDEDCGDTDRFSCRPVQVGSRWSLQCVRR